MEWADKAACKDGALDFYDFQYAGKDREDTINWRKFGPLVLMCAGCPVVAECAAFAIRRGGVEEYGVWAGTTPKQRRAAAGAGDPVGAMTSALLVNSLKAGADASQLDFGAGVA